MRDSLVFLSISANVCVLISPLDICSGIQVWSGIPSLCMLSSTCYSGFSGARSMASLLMSKGLSFPLSCWVWNARVHRRFSLATGPLPSLCLCWEKRLVAFPMWSLGKQPGCEGSLDEERSSLQLAAHPVMLTKVVPRRGCIFLGTRNPAIEVHTEWKEDAWKAFSMVWTISLVWYEWNLKTKYLSYRLVK